MRCLSFLFFKVRFLSIGTIVLLCFKVVTAGPVGAAQADSVAGVPALDQNQPERIEVALFALG